MAKGPQRPKGPTPTVPPRISRRGRVNEGRPPRWTDPVAMQARIDEYFAFCDNRTADKVDDDGNVCTYPNPAPYGIANLCYWLGFEDRTALMEYEKKPEFSLTVKRARMKVEGWWEDRLGDKAPVGAIFWLKNNAHTHAYRDVTESKTEHSGAVGVVLASEAEIKMRGRPIK